jgi:hypothetical protein
MKGSTLTRGRVIFAGHTGKITLLPGTLVHGGFQANW